MFCTAAYVTCNYGELIPYQATGMNPYDMRIKCEHGVRDPSPPPPPAPRPPPHLGRF